MRYGREAEAEGSNSSHKTTYVTSYSKNSSRSTNPFEEEKENESDFKNVEPRGNYNKLYEKEEELEGDEYSGDAETKHIQVKMKNIQRKDLELTRNMVQLLGTTNSLATETLSTLDVQTASKLVEQLKNAEKGILQSNVNLIESTKEANNIKKYSRLFAISMPKIFSRSKKQAEKDIIQAEAQIKEFNDKRTSDSDYRLKAERIVQNGKLPKAVLNANSEPNRKSLGDEELDENENEINQNLDVISSHLSNLKNLGLQIQDTLDYNNRQIDRISEQSDRAGDRISLNTRKLKKFM